MNTKTLKQLILICVSLASATFFFLEPAFAAPQNGTGIVWNRSNCGSPFVRQYTNGGAGSASSCGLHDLPLVQLRQIRSNHRHNWSMADLNLTDADFNTGPIVTNGNGAVFNRSNCGYPNVRMYLDGGAKGGYSCGKYNMTYPQLDTIWNWPNINVLPTAVGYTTEQSLGIGAERNGSGLVFNKSDCGAGNVRMYSLGGEGAGSKCNTWDLSDTQIAQVWSNANHNFSTDELGVTATIVGKLMIIAAHIFFG